MALTARKRALFAVLPALGLLLVLEGAAWIGDARTGFRASLLRALDAVESHADPLVPTGELPWPEPVIHVRRAEPDDVEQRPWVVGGVAIEDSISQLFDTPTDPDDVAAAGGRPVFVVGGSAPFGHPYAYEDVFPTLLDARLRDRGYRVLNAGQIGWPSAGVADVVDRITAFYDPAAVIIMCGNNEWIHWTPPHQPWREGTDLEAIRRWSSSRAFALVAYWSVERAIERMDDVRAERQSFAVHRELVGIDYALAHPMERYVEFDAQGWLAAKERFLGTFEQNLRHMVRATKASGARAILVTVPFNYRLSPAWKHPQPESFLSEHRDEVRGLVADAAAARGRGDEGASLSAADRALALDPHPPILHALRGAALERMGRLDDARAAYAACREHMVGHLGGRLSVNERIRRVAASEEAVLVDAAQLFDAAQSERGGAFDRGLVHDDAHPTPAGHRIIADALAESF